MQRLPELWRGQRRGLLVRLAATGLGQAAIAAVTAVLTPRLLSVPDRTIQLQLATALVAMALVLGGLRVMERVLGEKLGQDYVHEVRMHLIRAALAGRGPSVGVTIARTTNDLSSVRNWIVLGIVPLLVGVPMVAGSLLALLFLSPPLAASVALPLALLGVVLGLLAPRVRERAAALRRTRGKLAGVITDTVQARDSVVTAGGTDREIRRLAQDSRELGRRAVSRAVLSGALRGSAASVATVAMVVVGATGAITRVEPATIATAFIIVGMLATPVSDLGRVSEYRQSFRVAQRILAPEMERSRRQRQHERELDRNGNLRPREGNGIGVVHLADLEPGGQPAPDLVAHPGEVVVVRSRDPQRVRELVDLLVQPGSLRDEWLLVDGQNLSGMSSLQRRDFVSVAAPEFGLERSTIARAVRYRAPQSDEDVMDTLDAVGLGDDVRRLDRGERTMLSRGGEPLNLQQRMRLLLARAWYGSPPLVVLDRIDAGLGPEGRRLMAEGLKSTPGVTLLISDRADQLAPGHRVWDLDADPQSTAMDPQHLAAVTGAIEQDKEDDA
ncbi:ABC transporter transmembrane domain-containing protein [Luteococcus sp. Sow4_B9]|uniref:ABC transporter transmembrane domain-containing protein n=1 Tax=Luteococcus sp. Sow4_B9 TaxID=3438792 RepID=UPI003F96B015